MSESGIDFEKAEYENPESARPDCASCKSPIAHSYWDVNGQLVCERCQLQLSEELARPVTLNTWLNAVGFGIVAAIAGAIVWALITKSTGYAIGLVAIGVGWLVGKAVAKGSGSRGGVGMQVVAVLLTYLAVVSQYVPDILEARPDFPLSEAILLAVQIPILRGLEGFMGLLILGFALWEAYRQSASMKFEVRGPFTLNRES